MTGYNRLKQPSNGSSHLTTPNLAARKNIFKVFLVGFQYHLFRSEGKPENLLLRGATTTGVFELKH